MKRKKDNLLNRLKQKYRRPVTLTGRYYRVAQRMLLDTAKILNAGNVNYLLDKGALLGLVRDGDLIPWDKDLDLILPATELNKFRKLYFKFRMRGWRIREDSVMPTDGPGWRKGDPRSIKIRNRNFLFFGRGRIVMDVIVNYKHDGYYWRGAMGKIWQTPEEYYDQHEIMTYCGVQIRIPFHAEQYLSVRYGNWKTPDKDYDPVSRDGGLYSDLDKWENKPADQSGKIYRENSTL